MGIRDSREVTPERSGHGAGGGADVDGLDHRAEMELDAFLAVHQLARPARDRPEHAPERHVQGLDDGDVNAQAACGLSLIHI